MYFKNYYYFPPLRIPPRFIGEVELGEAKFHEAELRD